MRAWSQLTVATATLAAGAAADPPSRARAALVATLAAHLLLLAALAVIYQPRLARLGAGPRPPARLLVSTLPGALAASPPLPAQVTTQVAGDPAPVATATAPAPASPANPVAAALALEPQALPSPPPAVSESAVADAGTLPNEGLSRALGTPATGPRVAGVAAPLPATVSSPLVGLRSLADLAMPAALARPRLPPPATVAAALVAAVVAPGSQPLVAADGDAGPNADPAAAATAIEVVEQDLQWAGSARAVVRPVEIAFPAALARIGVEAEVEVQLTVAADGLPGRGEIRRSSGDGAVDAAVVQALRGYLFAAGEQAVALNLTVRFRYERPF